MHPSFKQIREWAGVTQEELADKLGITTPMISMIESGRRILSPGRFRTAEKALGLRPGYFLCFYVEQYRDRLKRKMK